VQPKNAPFSDLAVIYLGLASLPASSGLPTGAGRAALDRRTELPVYLALQPIRFTHLPGCPNKA